MNANQSKWRTWVRDIFLGGTGLAVLYNQVYEVKEAQPLLIFLVIFLWGCIPALRGDSRRQDGEYSPFARVIMSLLGVKLPENFKDSPEGLAEAGQDESPFDGPAPPSGHTSAQSEPSSSKSDS